jgi:hypothetical protein
VAESEDRGERLDRELIELLNELRVILPGIQVLFAFLLTVPFTQVFSRVTEGQRAVYFAAFLCTAVSSAFLIAPSAYHRIRWRQRDKERLLRFGNIFAIVGTVLLGLSVTATVYLVTDLLFDVLATSLAAAGVGGLLAVLWFGLPLARRVEDDGTGRASS